MKLKLGPVIALDKRRRYMAPSLWSHAWHVIYGPEILDKVMWSSWWRCLSTPFVKGYPQFKFKLPAMSGSWKTGRNFFFLCETCSSNYEWLYIPLRGNFLLRGNSVCILTLLYLKSETSAHVQLRNYSFLHTIWKFHDMVSVWNLHWG